jgi:endonuclease-8
MPEGDTVWLTAHRLDKALRDRPLTIFQLRVPALATVDRTGEIVTEVIARGKHILTRLDSGVTLHSHLRMDGSWQLSRSGTAPRAHPDHMIRAVLGNCDWLATGYRVHDLDLIPTVEETRVVGHLGPDLLGPDWDADLAAHNLVQAPSRAIGEALLDQRNLAGIGNMYRAEILFVQGINPWLPVERVRDLPGLMRTAYRLLRMNRDHPEQSTTGFTQRGRQHWVYLRGGQPCLRCGTSVASAEQGEAPRQRLSFWCPTCQPAARLASPNWPDQT